MRDVLDNVNDHFPDERIYGQTPAPSKPTHKVTTPPWPPAPGLMELISTRGSSSE